jgi:hypothetical protein
MGFGSVRLKTVRLHFLWVCLFLFVCLFVFISGTMRFSDRATLVHSSIVLLRLIHKSQVKSLELIIIKTGIEAVTAALDCVPAALLEWL